MATRKPKRSRFSQKHRSDGVRLADVLRQYQRDFPRFAPQLNDCIQRVIEDAERTRAMDRAKVLQALGAWDGLYIEDIMEDTGLSRWDVRQLLPGLIKQGLVVEKPEPREKLSPACWRYIYALKR